MALELHTNLPKRDYSKFLRELFSRPIDYFDFFVFSEKVSTRSILFFNFTLWLYAVICKLIYNTFVIYALPFFLEEYETSITLTSGLFKAFLPYPIIFLGLYFFHFFRKAYQKKMFIPYNQNLVFLSFLPFSASCIFWLFPSPFPFLLSLIAFIYSMKIYYEGLIHLENLQKRDILNIIFIFATFCLTISFFALTLFGYLRSL